MMVRQQSRTATVRALSGSPLRSRRRAEILADMAPARRSGAAPAIDAKGRPSARGSWYPSKPNIIVKRGQFVQKRAHDTLCKPIPIVIQRGAGHMTLKRFRPDDSPASSVGTQNCCVPLVGGNKHAS